MSSPTEPPPAEPLAQLQQSVARERLVYSVAFIMLFCWIALNRNGVHSYWPIVLFVVIGNVMSLRRDERLIAAMRTLEPLPAGGTNRLDRYGDRYDDDDDE